MKIEGVYLFMMQSRQIVLIVRTNLEQLLWYLDYLNLRRIICPAATPTCSANSSLSTM